MTRFITEPWLFVILFFAVITALMLINARVNREFKVEGAWVAVAGTPAILWLVLSGRITEMALPGGTSVKMASTQPVSLKTDGEKVIPDKIVVGAKGTDNLEELKRRGTVALSFQLGSANYADSAVLHFLEQLPQVKYLIFTHPDGTYAGFSLVDRIRDAMAGSTFSLASAIESGDTDSIPRFEEASVSKEDSRAKALHVMDDLGLEVVPVVDDKRKFVGILDRDKVTSSIVADLVVDATAAR